MWSKQHILCPIMRIFLKQKAWGMDNYTVLTKIKSFSVSGSLLQGGLSSYQTMWTVFPGAVMLWLISGSQHILFSSLGITFLGKFNLERYIVTTVSSSREWNKCLSRMPTFLLWPLQWFLSNCMHSIRLTSVHLDCDPFVLWYVFWAFACGKLYQVPIEK